MAEPDSLKLGSRPPGLADLRRVYEGPVSVQIDAAALGAVREAHAVTARLAAADAPAYGINPGFGLLAHTRIPAAQPPLPRSAPWCRGTSFCRTAPASARFSTTRSCASRWC